jgi:hypothetical protein
VKAAPSNAWLAHASLQALRVPHFRMILLLFIATVIASSPRLAASAHFDVLVYGSTPGGIQAAISASLEGASVALVSPSVRVGGMMTSGLGHTDKGNTKAIGGAAMKFFHDVCPSTAAPPCWDFPPSRAMDLFQRMLAAAPNVTVMHEYSVAAVTRDGTVVTSITLTPQPSLRSNAMRHLAINISAYYFIDSSYEGDLIAAAAISTTIGREAQSL